METTNPTFTKVFWAGLIQLVLTTILSILQDGSMEKNMYVIGFSLLITVGTYLGRNLRGVAASIVTVVMASIVNYFNLHPEGGPIDRHAILIEVLALGSAIIGIFFTSPAKSIGYERTNLISEAKAEGEQMVATSAAPAP